MQPPDHSDALKVEQRLRAATNELHKLAEPVAMARQVTARVLIKWEKDGECIRCINRPIGTHGYVTMYYDKRIHTMPRIILMRRGINMAGLDAMHSCDHKWCINPAHLSAGTRSQNMKDCARRGMHRTARGEAAGKAKLTNAHVIAIRSDARTCRKIASEYGVTHQSIQGIKARYTWKHLS